VTVRILFVAKVSQEIQIVLIQAFMDSVEGTGVTGDLSGPLLSYSTERSSLADTLVRNLNDLLASLELPITINTPYDLTPSLLLAILESILRNRLPLSGITRDSQTFAAKVEVMKVFLGVLEDDMLQMDIGLSDIDPRRLAKGEWDEVVFVGAVLCWLGRRRDQVDNVYLSQTDHPEASSSKSSGTSTSADTGLPQYDTSDTTVDPADSVLQSVDTSGQLPRCIHEFDVSSFSFDTQCSETELCDCSLHRTGPPEMEDTSPGFSPPRQHPSVRYQGQIRPVKDDIEEFTLWHGYTRSSSRHVSNQILFTSMPFVHDRR
jgi:hypothetical protein